MARKKFSTLTEPMFYLLMALKDGDKCGIEISTFIARRSADRVKLGPGTLYALLGDFERESIIRQSGADGKRKTYSITQAGNDLYDDEILRLKSCINDAEGGQEHEQLCQKAYTL